MADGLRRRAGRGGGEKGAADFDASQPRRAPDVPPQPFSVVACGLCALTFVPLLVAVAALYAFAPHHLPPFFASLLGVPPPPSPAKQPQVVILAHGTVGG